MQLILLSVLVLITDISALLNALARLILPDPVTLKRFLAPEFVFCLGISLLKIFGAQI